MKGVGYLVSMISVLLLALPALEGAQGDRTMLICLIGGVAASLTGMLLRWWSYRRETKANPAANGPA